MINEHVLPFLTAVQDSLQAVVQDHDGIRRGWSFQDRVSMIARPIAALVILVGIHYLARHYPWPRPFRFRFALVHLLLAPVVAFTWVGLSRLFEAPFLGFGPTVPHETEFLGTALIGYPIVTGIMYSVESTARAARAESAAARTQLAALRAQLHPHFLFNALHTVVQLIPVNPTLAMEAAEIVAELLRSSLEEQREEVPLADEWRFVSRYLTVERIRFGDRLIMREDLPAELMDATVPAFALQTLVENAVRHGAAPRVAATEISVAASGGRSQQITLRVWNSAKGEALADVVDVAGVVGDAVGSAGARSGTGLARLRERLAVLYGTDATLTHGPVEGGYEAVLVIPQSRRTSA